MKTIKIIVFIIFLFVLIPHASIAQDRSIVPVIYEGYETIGTLNISKINVSLPILANTTDDRLEVSVCRFYNKIMPNTVGNLVIVGHNAHNDTLFSNLKYVDIGDSFNILSLDNSNITYVVYNKFYVSPDERI